MNKKIEFQDKIKKDLINYYDSMKFTIDIKVQELLKLECYKQDLKYKLLDENNYLIEQIDRILNSNLDDVRNFFEKWDEEKDLEISEFDNATEEIKKRALNNYIINIKYKNQEILGLYMEFEWYIDENQLNFIRY